MGEIKEVRIKKCHKCGSKDIVITELWINHSIQWEVFDGFIKPSEGNLEPGNPYKIVIQCFGCESIWTARKAMQINDLFITEFKNP